jgi:hypothetical protein
MLVPLFAQTQSGPRGESGKVGTYWVCSAGSKARDQPSFLAQLFLSKGEDRTAIFNQLAAKASLDVDRPRGLAPVSPDTAYSQYSGGCSVSA